MRRLFALLALLAPLALAPVASAQERHEHSANMSHVKNLPYAVDNGGTPNYGTDIEFATLAGKKYALAGSYKNGLQIVDISNPEEAKIVSTYDCGVTQGDVQVFHQADEPGRTFVGYASDTFGDGTSTCYREAQALGYGIVLQAVEIATAVVMGAPALVKEGVSWREVRLRALHTSPVSLGAPSPQKAQA